MPSPLKTAVRRALFLLAVNGVVGCAEAPTPPASAPPRVTVQHPIQRQEVDYNTYNGWTDASATVEIRARVRGHIDKVDFTDGQLVKEGDPLFELDPRPFEAELSVAKSQIEVAKAQLAFETEEEKRNVELFAKKVVTQSELDKVVASRKTWESKVIAAEEEARRRQLDLDYAKIVAPLSGKIGRARLVAGNLVGAGGSDPLLTTIVALDPIHVYFFVDERGLLEYRRANAEKRKNGDAKDLKIPMEFALETDTGFPRKGTLDFSENKIDAATGTIEVRGTAPNADTAILPGSRVRIRVPVNDPYQATLVPDSAVLSDQDQRYLLCLNKDNVVVRRNITLGRLLDDGLRVILPGPGDGSQVSPEDWVIVLGLQRARINYPVEPMDENGEPISTKVPAPAAR